MPAMTTPEVTAQMEDSETDPKEPMALPMRVGCFLGLWRTRRDSGDFIDASGLGVENELGLESSWQGASPHFSITAMFQGFQS